MDVVDTDPPVITLVGGPTQSVECGSGPYVDPGFNAIDLCDGVVTPAVMPGGGPVDTTMPGIYILTDDVSDSSGNAALQVTRTVTVSV